MTHWLVRYSAAVLVVFVGIAALQIPDVGGALISVVFLAVLFSAWFGGLGPGLVTTGLITAIALSHVSFVKQAFTLRDTVWIALFAPCGLLISVMLEMLHAARRRVEVSNRWQTAVLKSIGDGVITTNDQGIVTFLNPIAETLTGWSLDEATKRPLDEIFRTIKADTRSSAHNPANQSLRNGTATSPLKRTILVARDGTQRPVEDSHALIKSNAGVVTGTVLVFRDASAREQAQNAQATLASIVESSSDAIISNDVNGIVTSWNSAAHRVFGYRSVEMIGRSILTIVPPERHAAETDLMTRRSQGEMIETYDSIRIAQNGAPIVVSLTISPILDNLGQVVGLATIARDLAEHKRLEQEVNRRVLQLADGNRRRDEFLAMLAHELRNPLAAINSAVHATSVCGVPEPMVWCMEIITRQVSNLTRMINDLLEVSRITRGRIVLQKSHLEIAPILSNAIESTRPFIETRQHQVLLTITGPELHAEADPVRLEQIIANLLNNAAKYTEPGARIWLSAEQDNDSIVIKVRDPGMGIPPDRLESMFELFTQGDRALARSEGGLGIGLTVARSLAEMHGGTLSATSQGRDTGSEFVLRLPATPLAADAVAGSPAPTTIEPRPRARARVMIIDDNIDLARGMAGLLQLLDHQVWVAYDGPSGLEAIRAHRPEVVLLDIGLPGMDGFEVAGQLRREEFGKQMLLIAVTGYGQEEDRQHAFSAGFDHFVTKPVDYPTLLALMVNADQTST